MYTIQRRGPESMGLEMWQPCRLRGSSGTLFHLGSSILSLPGALHAVAGANFLLLTKACLFSSLLPAVSLDAKEWECPRGVVGPECPLQLSQREVRAWGQVHTQEGPARPPDPPSEPASQHWLGCVLEPGNFPLSPPPSLPSWLPGCRCWLQACLHSGA